MTQIERMPLVEGIDKPVSAIALGTAHFRADERDRWFDMMDQFVASGGTAIDTAHNYGDSEVMIGLWMAEVGNRDGVVICTKGAHGTGILPAENFQQIIQDELMMSLDRLKTDHIDLYWLHRDNPGVLVGPIVECLNAHLAAGRIRAFGGSNWTYDRVEQAQAYARAHGLTGFAAVSNNLSLAVQTEPFYPGLVSVDSGGMRWHTETGVPLFSWSSQARGFFTGRYNPEMREQIGRIEDGLTRRMIEVFCTDENFERLRRADQLGREKGGCSAVEIALAWVRRQPISIVPVVGPRTPEELASCVRALSVELTEDEIGWLNLA